MKEKVKTPDAPKAAFEAGAFAKDPQGGGRAVEGRDPPAGRT